MTTATGTHPLTASAFLFGEDQDAGQALARALNRHGVLSATADALGAMSQALRMAAADQVAVVAQGLLDLDLGDLLTAGWRKQGALAAAAERTAANPGSSELVEMATHRITSVHRPFVEVLVNDAHVANVRFELHIEFVVRALAVIVRAGHIVSIRSGECDVSVNLAAEGMQLASRQGHVELPLIVRWPLPLRLGVGAAPLSYGSARP